MSRSELAKNCGHLAVGAVALSLGTAAGATIGAIAAINLAAVWRDMKSACVPTARTAAIKAALDALEANREFPADAIDTAAALLAEPPIGAAFAPDDTVDLLAEDRYVAETSSRLTAMMNPGDPTVAAVLDLCFSAAVTACLRSEGFRTDIQWDVDLSTLQAVHRVETLMGDVLRELRAAHKITDIALVQMAKRVGRDAYDRESALATLDQAVDAYLRLAAQGATESNHPDFIDEVFAEVARLNAEAREDDAADAFETALAREEEESIARKQKLLTGLRDQHILRGDAEGLAEVQERLLRLEGHTGAALYHALREWGFERYREGERLGLRFDLQTAAAAFTRCAPLAPDEEWRGGSLNDLGNALLTLGERGDADALRRAVTIHRSAMEVSLHHALPQEFSNSQNSLGMALTFIGQRENDVQALQGAVGMFHLALTVRSRDAFPEEWGNTQNNLGNAFSILGELGEYRFLPHAINAYKAALTVQSRTHPSKDWGITQMNLGNAYRALGELGDVDSFRLAIDAYNAALKVRTYESVPVQWAMTRENMALCFEAMAQAFPDAAEAHRAAALAAIEDALTVYDPDSMPYRHEEATALRDRLRAER